MRPEILAEVMETAPINGIKHTSMEIAYIKKAIRLDPNERVCCAICLLDRNHTSYGIREAWLCSADHLPYNGEANYICNRHLDVNVVFVAEEDGRVVNPLEKVGPRLHCAGPDPSHGIDRLEERLARFIATDEMNIPIWKAKAILEAIKNALSQEYVPEAILCLDMATQPPQQK